MTKIVDNRNSTIDQENAITERNLISEALNGRFYSYDEHKWQSVGWVERLVRTFFCCFLDSVEITCLRRSWEAIEKMPSIPKDIKDRIEDLFLDSLYYTNPSSSCSGAIGRIFCRAHYENALEKEFTVNQIDIQQHSTDRSFGIFYNRKLCCLVANSEYGQLNFYNPECGKIFINNYDTLWSTEARRVGGIRLGVDYPRLDSSMEFCAGEELSFVKVVGNKEKVTLVFRDNTTNRLLAVGNLSKSGRLINWAVTLINQEALDKKQITPILLAWAILKYSQHYHFSSPEELKYVRSLPQIQDFCEFPAI